MAELKFNNIPKFIVSGTATQIPANQIKKLEHYSAIASGKKAPKKESKFSKAEQIAYARGQRDARNEANRIYAYYSGSDDYILYLISFAIVLLM